MKKNIFEIIDVSNEIYDKGLVSGKAGNISARFKGENGDIIGITPTLKSLSDLSEEDIVLVDLDGNVLTRGKPSSEVNMHIEIYKKRPDVNGIVHTHSPYATGFAFSSKRLKRLEGFMEAIERTPLIDAPIATSIATFSLGDHSAYISGYFTIFSLISVLGVPG